MMVSLTDNLLHLIHILDRRRQILVPIFRNEDIILDAHTAYIPVLIQNIEVDVCSVYRVSEVRLDYEAAEVDLVCMSVSVLLWFFRMLVLGINRGMGGYIHQAQQ